MNIYLGFLRRRFLWAVAGLVVFLSYTVIWGDWFVRTLLSVTGLGGADPYAGDLGAGQWFGLVAGTVMVMAPAVLGFLAYMVSWIGWPGRPVPRRAGAWAGVGMGLGVAVTAFQLVALMGNYWPPGQWRTGTRQFARSDFATANTEWVGDMYFGMLVAVVSLYIVVLLCAALLPADVNPGGKGRGGRGAHAVEAGRVAIAGRSSPGSRKTHTFTPGGLERDPLGDSDPGSAPALSPADHFANRPSHWGTDDPRRASRGSAVPAEDADLPVTGIWWPYAAGGAAVVVSVVAALWPHVTAG